MEEKQENEFTINDLINIFWERRILIAAVAAILTVFILLLGASYRYNRIMTRVTFEAYWPGIEEQRYINNTFFDYQDFLNPSLFERTRELFNDNYEMRNILANFNFRDAIFSGNVRIERIERVERNEITENGIRENLNRPMIFSIVINSNALRLTHHQAQEMVGRYLQDVFFGYFLENKNTSFQYGNTLRADFESFELIDTVASIRTQRWELERSIHQLREYPILSLANQERLNALERRISSFFLRNNPDLLLMEIQNNGYFRDIAFLPTINSRILMLDVMIDERMQLIQLYNDAYANFNDITSTFPELNAVLHELPRLNSERERYQRILEAMNGSAPFTQTQLEEFEQRLLGFVEQFDEFYHDLHAYALSIRNENTILLITSKTITIPMRMTYIVIGSLVLSTLAGMAVGIGHYYFSKYKKKIFAE